MTNTERVEEMGKSQRWGTALVLGAAMVLVSSSAQAAYVLSVVDSATGLSSATLAPGDSISLDLVAVSDGDDNSNSFTLPVRFDAPGLQYDGYEFPGIWATATDFTPAFGFLGYVLPPTILGDMTGWAATEATGAQHTSGPLVTFGLTVPADWFGRSGNPGSVTITTGDHIPGLEGINDGFDEVPSIAGAPFTLNIPEPATLALLAIGGLAVVRRRKNA